MKKLLLFFAVLLTTVRASAYDFEVDGIYYNVLSEKDLTCEVTYTTDERNLVTASYSGRVVIPSTVTYNEMTLTVTRIGKYAFYKCTSLTSVKIPNSVTRILDSAFWKCESLKSVVIPNSVTWIGEQAFRKCSSLTSVVIGNSVKAINYRAFSDCSNLTEIVSLSTTPPQLIELCFAGVPTSTCILKVPIESVELYKSAKEWKDFQNIVVLTDDEMLELNVSILKASSKAERGFNLNGQPVPDSYRGIVIQNRKKIMRR